MAKKHKEFDYFEAFEQQARLIVQQADLLVDSIKQYESSEGVEEVMKKAHELEHEGDEVTQAIYRAVAHDFITPIDRDDIIEMADSLDNVNDYLEGVVQRFYMYDVQEMHEGALEFAKVLKKSGHALSTAMEDFKNFKRSKQFKHLVGEVSGREEEADQLYVKLIRGLHTADKQNPMRVYVWSNIFRRMENCADACEHAADVMNGIMLKNI